MSQVVAEQTPECHSPTQGVDAQAATFFPAIENTMIVFDWDDTLFPYHWLTVNGVNFEIISVPSKIVEEMGRFSHLICQILMKAMAIGQVYIITNAQEGWVEATASVFMPNVYSLLQDRSMDNYIRIVSARRHQERLQPDSPETWKIETFRTVILKFFDGVESHQKKSIWAESGEVVEMDNKCAKGPLCRNVLSIGDSTNERLAINEMREYDRNTESSHFYLLKNVKLNDFPTMESLRIQLQVVSNYLEFFSSFNSDLDLMLSEPTSETKSEPTSETETKDEDISMED
jgi:hypothetical protein